MDANAAVSLLEHAFEQEEDQRIFARWVQGAQYKMSFSDFKKALRKPPVKSTDAILNDVGNILQAFEKER